MQKITKEEIAQILCLSPDRDPDQLTLSSGKFTIRKGYYWTPNRSPEEFFSKTLFRLENLFEISDVTYGDNYKSFNGGEGIKKNSHYWMKFKAKRRMMYPEVSNENKTIDVA